MKTGSRRQIFPIPASGKHQGPGPQGLKLGLAPHQCCILTKPPYRAWIEHVPAVHRAPVGLSPFLHSNLTVVISARERGLGEPRTGGDRYALSLCHLARLLRSSTFPYYSQSHHLTFRISQLQTRSLSPGGVRAQQHLAKFNGSR